MISVVIPIANLKELTDECVETLVGNAYVKPEVIVIDNASEVPYQHPSVTTIRNEKNAGYWPSMLQGIQAASNNIIMTMHNDVFLWEEGWDQRFLTCFQLDPLLAVAGLFGSPGVGINGARLHSQSNMQGKKYGMSYHQHSDILTTDFPSTVFDSLAMCFNRELLYQSQYESLPPHHWTDRLVCLRLLREGYHALTVGSPFDHGGGFTSTGGKTMNTFTEDWCREQGLELDQTWDHTLYEYGRKIFEAEFSHFTQGRTQLWTNQFHQLQPN